MFRKSFWLVLVCALAGRGAAGAACESGTGTLASISTLCSVAQNKNLPS